MSAESQNPPPTVFISYSHDTKDHKAWVADLGSRLRGKGVEAILDQWDTELGDDMTKFMERGVKQSDRVLMICTEPYVRKVDDGKGGAGYEAMIVTSELVRDQGVNKFIPIIRQTTKERVTPVCLSTRKYVDLSSDKNFEEGFVELIETIHKVVTARKPPLGPNPFSGNEPSSQKQQDQKILVQHFAPEQANPETAYNTARALIGAHDLAGWRKLVQTLASVCAEKLLTWKKARQENCPSTPYGSDPKPLWDYVGEGVACYDPLLGCLCAAAESGDRDFAGQLGWIDLVLNPKDWERSGSAFWTEFPRTILFTLHTRLGSILLHSSNAEDAFRLSTTPIGDPYSRRDSAPIYLTHDLMGWQATLGRYCTVGWGFLGHLIEQTKWLNPIFGSEEKQRSALVSYFMLTSFLEYCREAAKKDHSFEAEKLSLDTPQYFCRSSDETLRSAYALFLEQRVFLKLVLEKNGLNESDLRKTWAKWIAAELVWLREVYRFSFDGEDLPHRRLSQDLYNDPYKL